MLKPSTATDTLSAFAADVRDGLTQDGQKEIPSKYLYDDLGSKLFEAIMLAPEYGLANADERLLKKHARAIAGRLPENTVVTELGCGSGKKTRWLLEELARRQPTTFFPIDISSAAIEQCQWGLEFISGLEVSGIEGSYILGLQEVIRRRPPRAPLLVLFLGSTLGNFKPEEAGDFLAEVRSLIEPDDRFLLSTDLIKPTGQLLAAYDDPLGITSAFNLNLLTRMNRELGANFDLTQFGHLALFNHDKKRIEMHILSLPDQTATIPGADLTVEFRKDETIWTECSHKFLAEDVAALGEKHGFRCDTQWIDEEWPFAQTLFVAE